MCGVYLTRIYCERVVVSLLSCRTVLLTSTIPSVLFISVRGFLFFLFFINMSFVRSISSSSLFCYSGPIIVNTQIYCDVQNKLRFKYILIHVCYKYICYVFFTMYGTHYMICFIECTAREWALVCVRNACMDNPRNQHFVDKLKRETKRDIL